MMRALCVGSAMIDIIVLVDSRNVERMTMHNATSSFLLLEQGSKIQAESISAHVGGGAVNAAVAMARLGLDAAALVKIGRDANGDKIIDRHAADHGSARMDTGNGCRGGEISLADGDTDLAVPHCAVFGHACSGTRRTTNGELLRTPSELKQCSQLAATLK
jgi:hypothetical protein